MSPQSSPQREGGPQKVEGRARLILTFPHKDTKPQRGCTSPLPLAGGVGGGPAQGSLRSLPPLTPPAGGRGISYGLT